MKNVYLFIISCIMQLSAAAQKSEGSFYDGYVLRGNDTIKCKVLYNFEHYHSGHLTVKMEDETLTFHPGSIITGYGVYHDTLQHHYGHITVEIQIRMNNQVRTNVQEIYARKLVAGIVNLHVHTYVIGRTVPAEPGRLSNPSLMTTEKFTQYYISKSELGNPPKIPVRLFSLRKKELEKYIGDNESLYENARKYLSEQELIVLLNEYNNWYLTKKN